jgi:menaquinone-specific isochorismate synthase
VTHLGTRITGELRDPSTSVLDLVANLHPTAAVGGEPSAAALRWLAQHESLDRGRYAGPVGWIDAAGNGEWWVGIRCAEIDDNRAVLRAGCGIVAGSDPASELMESQLKLQALLAALVRP